jgi:hypothetical protein
MTMIVMMVDIYHDDVDDDVKQINHLLIMRLHFNVYCCCSIFGIVINLNILQLYH